MKKELIILCIAIIIFCAISVNAMIVPDSGNPAYQVQGIKPVLSNKIPGLSNIISPSIDSLYQPKGFDLSYLSDCRVKELARLNLEKINIKKIVSKYYAGPIIIAKDLMKIKKQATERTGENAV